MEAWLLNCNLRGDKPSTRDRTRASQRSPSKPSERFMDAAAQGGGTPAGTAKVAGSAAFLAVVYRNLLKYAAMFSQVITNGLMATGPVFQECGEWPEGVMPAGRNFSSTLYSNLLHRFQFMTWHRAT